MGFQDKDRGLKKITRELRRANLKATVGIQGSRALQDHGGINNVTIGVINEFGAPLRTIFGNPVDGKEIPERSFIRSTFDERNRAWLKLLAARVGAAIDRREPMRRPVSVVAEVMSSDTKKKIRSGPFAAISELTRKLRERAGFAGTKPLNVSGQLRNSITAVVEND